MRTATSTSGLDLSSSPADSRLYDKLNAQWHERALQLFMLIVLAHWGEHLAQAVQIYIMGWPSPEANGVLGLWYPWLVKSELLHYAYAIVMLAGIWVLRKGFAGIALKWWTVALVIQFWHHIEHFLLIWQAATNHNFWNKPVPFSIVQLFIPRVELHLFYNSLVFIPMVIGMYYHMFPPAGEPHSAVCSCAVARHPAHATTA